MKYIRKAVKKDFLNQLSLKNRQILKSRLMDDFLDTNIDRQEDESSSNQKFINKIDQLRAELEMYKKMYAEAEMQRNILNMIIKDNENGILG